MRKRKSAHRMCSGYVFIFFMLFYDCILHYFNDDILHDYFSSLRSLLSFCWSVSIASAFVVLKDSS